MEARDEKKQTYVCGHDDDGIICLAQALQLGQQLAQQVVRESGRSVVVPPPVLRSPLVRRAVGSRGGNFSAAAPLDEGRALGHVLVGRNFDLGRLGHHVEELGREDMRHVRLDESDADPERLAGLAVRARTSLLVR